MARIISIANQKGGVGKTTTAINLSSALAHFNRHVLLVDLDPQGNSGQGLGIDTNSVLKSIFNVLQGTADAVSAVVKTKVPNLDIIPSNLKLASIEAFSQNDPFYILKKSLYPLADQYDYVIIDCPPSLGLLNINALVASTSVIIPVQCEYFALEAVAAILASINKIQNEYNNGLSIEGFLLTMYDPRTRLGTEVSSQVRGLFKENTFLSVIPRNISVPEASAKGLPVTVFRPSSQGALAYFSLAHEVIDHERT